MKLLNKSAKRQVSDQVWKDVTRRVRCSDQSKYLYMNSDSQAFSQIWQPVRILVEGQIRDSLREVIGKLQ
jgi:hypothetical protein